MITNWIEQAAMTFGLEIEALASTEVADLLARIRSRFCDKEAGARVLWDTFLDYVAVRREDGWERVCDYGESHPIILYEDRQTFYAFLFPSSEALRLVLAETAHFEFYVTNHEVAFVLCHNHHDYLMGVGECRPWLRDLSRQDWNVERGRG